MRKIVLKELPDKKDPKYLDVMIENAITAYGSFLSDSMVLDYIGCPVKTRSLILDNPEYKIRTRQIRAERYLDELGEIDELSKRFKDEVDRDTYDMADKKEASLYEADQKAWLAGKLKVAEMRRDLLRMTKDEDRNEEADALNIFFIPVTRSEFESLKTTEINDGDADASSALAEEAGGATQGQVLLSQISDESEINKGYFIDPVTGVAEDM